MIRCKFSSLPDTNKKHDSKNKITILVKNKDQNMKKNKNNYKSRMNNSNMLDDLDATK